jgi:HSP20 family protein
MALYYQHPYGRMMRRHMMNRMMDEDWGEQTARVVFPMDVKDLKEAYEITALLPGVTADDLNIQVINDMITIQGELKSRFDENDTYLVHEIPSGRFMRSVRLPDVVDSAKVDASLKDGVLTLYIPKAEEARPKTIKITTK